MTATRTIARWSESPYTDIDKRGWVIDHRVHVSVYDDAGVDVCHQVRSADDPSLPDDWRDIEVVEVRASGIRAHGMGDVPRAEVGR